VLVTSKLTSGLWWACQHPEITIRHDTIATSMKSFLSSRNEHINTSCLQYVGLFPRLLELDFKQRCSGNFLFMGTHTWRALPPLPFLPSLPFSLPPCNIHVTSIAYMHCLLRFFCRVWFCWFQNSWVAWIGLGLFDPGLGRVGSRELDPRSYLGYINQK